MKFFTELSGETYVLELNQTEAELLHSILEWVNRVSDLEGFNGKVSEEEIDLAGKISSDMIDYIYPQE